MKCFEAFARVSRGLPELVEQNFRLESSVTNYFCHSRSFRALELRARLSDYLCAVVAWQYRNCNSDLLCGNAMPSVRQMPS